MVIQDIFRHALSDHFESPSSRLDVNRRSHCCLRDAAMRRVEQRRCRKDRIVSFLFSKMLYRLMEQYCFFSGQLQQNSPHDNPLLRPRNNDEPTSISNTSRSYPLPPFLFRLLPLLPLPPQPMLAALALLSLYPSWPEDKHR